MKKPIVALFLVGVAAFAWLSLPTPTPPQGEAASGGHASHAGDPSALADGVVLSMDKGSNAVTINHGPLHNLGMPPMTMGFQVGDPALLDRIKPGDKVRFHVDVIGGAFTVMNIEPVK